MARNTSQELPVADLNHVSFDADFPLDRTEDDEPPGRELVDAIRGGLQSRGVQCGDVKDAGYAYFFDCQIGDTTCNVNVGLVDDEDGRQWLTFVEPRRRGLFKKGGAAASAVTAPLHDVLIADLHVAPQWFTEAQWNDASFGRGQPTPSDL
jgi:hypothetical protein